MSAAERTGAPSPSRDEPSGGGQWHPARTRADIGGDPACWLNRVCDTCGRFVDDEFAETCPACGAARL